MDAFVKSKRGEKEMFREYELSLLFLKEDFKEKGVRLNPSFKEELKSISKEMSVSFEDLLMFTQIIVGELVSTSTGIKVRLPAMNETKMGQLAFFIMVYKLRKEGIHLDAKLRRQVGHRASKIGISTDEAMVFTKLMVTAAFFDREIE